MACLHYYIDYPADDAHAYTVYAVRSLDAKQLEAALPNARRISRAWAIHFGWDLPRRAVREGRACKAGFAVRSPLIRRETLEDAIEECARATGTFLVRGVTIAD